MNRIIMNTPKLAMAACIAMLPLGGIADAQAQMPKRPNILFIHVDQLHWQALSAYGNPHVKTPAMDRIAADGISFRASYAADPIYCAARASWSTGRMSGEHGQANNGPYPLLKELPDLGGWLREHGGYETVYSGKWHITRPVTDGFRQIYGQGESKGAFHGMAALIACERFDADLVFPFSYPSKNQ